MCPEPLLKIIICLQASIGVRALLQGHAGGDQESKLKRELRRSFENRRFHVGRPRHGA